jgi:hypothetical protein
VRATRAVRSVPPAGSVLVLLVLLLVWWTPPGTAALAANPTPTGPSAERATEPAVSPAPATTIAMTPARPSLKLGVDKEIDVLIDLSGPDAGRFVPVRALATVGTLDLPLPVGPGHFVALYHPPADRFPEVALLMVELGAGAARLHCATRISLEGATLFPFHTSGGASVTMRVGDRQFGPVVADREGHVEIPIEVPPGVRRAEARAVDKSGGVRATEVDLQPPPFPRVLVLAPPSLEAGSFTEIVVGALDDKGAPVPAGQLTLAASAGMAHPRGGPPGEARFLFEAPVHLGGGAVALTAVASGTGPAPAEGRAELVIPLRAAPPSQLSISSSDRWLIVGDPRPISLSVSARDRFGNPASTAAVSVRVDGRPTPVVVTPAGQATFFVAPPAKYDGRENVMVDATLGDLSTSQPLHVTGGSPVRLTLQMAAGRIVADGRRGTQLRVQAVDKNGTPTSVSGLSWETPQGRIREIRVPRDGEYLAEYVPERTREAHRETITVMASQTLRADASFEVTPPPVRVVAGARTGLFTNFGETIGPMAFIEGLAPLHVRRLHLGVGFSAGYLRGDVSSGGVNGTGTARLETNQFPLLAVARLGVALPNALEIAAEVDLGWSWGWARVTASPAGTTMVDNAVVDAPAIGAGSELTYPLKPGWLAIGLRYLHIDLGRTSAGDQISGNSAGVLADLGYKMTF